MTDALLSIHKCAKTGDWAGVLAHLERGVNIDARDPRSVWTPLMAAVANPLVNTEFVRGLIAKGADVNAAARELPASVTEEQLNDLELILDSPESKFETMPNAQQVRDFLKSQREMLKADRSGNEINETVLSLAVRAGSIETVQTLLDAGADIGYVRSSSYDVLVDAMHRCRVAFDPQLIPLLQLLIARGARLSTESKYGESALSIASLNGRFDAIGVLLAAGASEELLQWTPLMRAIAIGSIEDVAAQLRHNPDLTARDRWSRTPWLLSLHAGDVAKAKLLLDAGSDRSARGRCGRTPLMYPAANEHVEMLRWLLSVDFDPNATDQFGDTALVEAIQVGAAACAQLLLDAGADLHLKRDSEPLIKSASDIPIARLLIDHGERLEDISDEMRAMLTRLPHDGILRVTREQYLAARHRRFGTSNPQKMNLPFWCEMIRGGLGAYGARLKFDDTASSEGPIWCFTRFGKSITELPDGRFIEIAGEHEDYYDADFCIYNDVVVHRGDGTFDIYGYPEECFPPTDFHSATLVGKYIYLIGSLGYPKQRKQADTPVYRLDTDTFEMEALKTTGEKPGWISRHNAVLQNGTQIRISGGQVCVMETEREQLKDNAGEYMLDLTTLVWSNVTA